MLRFLKESKIILIIIRYFFLNSLKFSFGFLYYVILYVIDKKKKNFLRKLFNIKY